MRKLGAIAGLVVGGAVVGTAATSLMIVAMSSLLGVGPFRADTWLIGIQVGLLVGAPAGAVIAPLGGWALLRRVPLWKAALLTGAGTIFGGITGGFLNHSAHAPGLIGTVVGAITGFLAAAALLARLYRAPVPARSNEEL